MADLPKLSGCDDNAVPIHAEDGCAQGFRKLTEKEQRDIAHLTEEKFLIFFNDFETACEGISKSDLDGGDYPEIMREFMGAVFTAARDFFRGNRDEPVWAKMRNKYFDGEPYVYPDEMIEKLDEFDIKEIIAFLHYCVIYKERFGEGAYGSYARAGYIGMLLTRLTELPQTLSL